MTSTEVDTMDAGSLRAAYRMLMNDYQHLAASYESLVRQQAPAEQEPVAWMLIDAPEMTTQGWEHGDFDIEWTKAAETFAQNSIPGSHPLYTSPPSAPPDQSARIAELEQALDEIANPVKYMRMRLEDGEQLSGMAAMQLGQSASYLRDIARAALAKHGESGK